MVNSLEKLQIDNRFVNELPGDPITENTRRQVNGACYSFVEPIKTAAPQLVCASEEMADLLGIAREDIASDLFLNIFSGNALLPEMKPYACCYGGHQFGNWAGQLGDGRAINLGEVVVGGKDWWTLQLKGAGPTPYSRTADGLAVLRSSLREFLCSEAMFHLGIPTTRALSLILTGDQVMRDMFYDGNQELEPGAVVCRVAPSFTRFGSFEIHATRDDIDTLKTLLDFTLKNEFPHLVPLLEKDPKTAYLSWFKEVRDKTAEMIVHWMRVGFVHGVMNTDNMSVHGLTIDYGPYGWLDNFDTNWTPNTTDAEGRRYSYGNQPAIGQWNLLQLANAIYPLIESVPELEEMLSDFHKVYMDAHFAMMKAKLGLRDECNDDASIINTVAQVLENCEVDMTLFYRNLAKIQRDQTYTDEELLAHALEFVYGDQPLAEGQQQALQLWMRSYHDRLQIDSISADERVALMNSTNPKYILRNYLAQQAIDKAEEGDFSMVHDLLDTMRKPYDEQPERERFSEMRPDWAKHKAGCSMLSCSS